MKKINKILFPTDFSDPSANAFRHALLLADQLDASISVLHVVFPQGETMDYPVMVAEVTQQKIEIAKEVIKTFVDTGITQLLQQIKKLPDISSGVEVGTTIRTIVDVAERDGADLIIIGSRGENRSGLDKLMGSVASGVVKKSKCPVIVVPESKRFKQVSTIAYATDILAADPYEIWKTTKMLLPFSAVVHCVHFNMKKDDSEAAGEKLKEMEEFFADQAPALQVRFHNLAGSKLENDLNDFAETYDVDLLVMFQPHMNFWNRIFHKSATKGMAAHTRVPLLIQKEA